MSVRRLDPVQPDSFAFTADNLRWAHQTIAKYPSGKQASAVIPLLWRAQEQNDGWVSEPAMRYVGDLLGMAYIRVYEVATFYTMFQLSPVGRTAHIQVCGTTPCMLRGAEDLIAVCRRRIAAHAHELSPDGRFSWEEVECLGACVNAPMVQIWKDTYEDLTPEALEALIDDLAAGRPVKPGPQNGRQFSMPEGGATSLTDPAVYAPNPPPQPPADEPETPTPIYAARPKPAAPEAAPALKGPVARKPAAGRPPARKLATVEVAAPAAPRASRTKAAEPGRPAGLARARAGKPDDLKLISGVGPKIEAILHSLGIFHFDQVAAWKKAERAWVDGYLNFKGRIERDDWVRQAKALAKGGVAEYLRVFGRKPR